MPRCPCSPQYVPIDEAHPLKAVSPYGNTKLIIEDILRDVSKSDPEWRIILLRYFNPVGAHPSGELGQEGEEPGCRRTESWAAGEGLALCSPELEQARSTRLRSSRPHCPPTPCPQAASASTR